MLAPGNFSLAEAYTLVHGLSLYASYMLIHTIARTAYDGSLVIHQVAHSCIVGILLIGAINYPLLRLVKFLSRSQRNKHFHALTSVQIFGNAMFMAYLLYMRA